MKNFCKILAATLCLACLMLCAVACNDNPDNPNNNPGGEGGNTSTTVSYTVTVTCDDAMVLAFLKVKLLNADGTAATEEKSLTDGKAVFDLKAGTYKVELSGALRDYDVPETSVTALTRSVTVALVLKEQQQENTKVEYKLKVTLPNGTPVVGKTMQVCGTEVGAQCFTAVTDSQGVATFNLPPKTYLVHYLDTLPEGYCFNDGQYTLTATTHELTVRLEVAVVYTITINYEATTNANGQPVAKAPAANVNVTLNREISAGNYEYNYASGTTNAQGKAEISVPAGAYSVNVACPEGYSCEQGLIVEDAEPELELVLSKIGSNAYNRIVVTAGETTVVVNAQAQDYWYQFNPQGKPGIYKIESIGSLDTYVEHYEGSGNNLLLNNPLTSSEDKQDISASDKNFCVYFEIGVEALEAGHGNIYVFHVGAQNLPTPITEQSFKIKITFVREINIVNIPVTQPQAQQITAQTKPQGTVTAVAPDAVVVYNETDGLYHIGSADGAVIYVAVGGSVYFPLLFDKNFADAYQESGGVGFAFSDGATYNYDYGQFLTQYSHAGNADGLHVLNNELKAFLQQYAISSHLVQGVSGWTYDVNGNMYLFACYYYAE